jgi:hypothetical protein
MNRILYTLFASFLGVTVSAQIRLTMVDPINQHAEIRNYGSSPTDISTYRFCSLFEYATLNQPMVQLLSGDFNLDPGESVIVLWNANTGFNGTASDVGLYLPAGGFSAPSAMTSFFEYGAGQQGRENVAVAAGLWATNTFLSGSGPWYYTGNGTEAGPAFWSTENPNGGETAVVINEVDCDTEASDVLEFIELIGEPNAPLDGIVVVLFNGASNNQSYAAYDLDGFVLSPTGFFVIGNELVPDVDLIVSNNSIQNGADGIGIYEGNAADWPNGTPASNVNLIDALVYGTDDAADQDLIDVLTPGHVQADEISATNNPFSSLSRVPDGGAPFNSSAFVQQGPTPGAANAGSVDCLGGTIALNENQLPELCIEEPNAPLQFTAAGSIGASFFIIATDATGVIVRIASNGSIDFTGLSEGTYTVTGGAYTGTVTLTEGMMLNDLISDECLSLSSNTIDVVVSSCSSGTCQGGLVSANNGSLYFSFCTDGNEDHLFLETTSTAEGEYVYVVTNASNEIEFIAPSPVNADLLSAGTHRIWGLSHFGALDESTTLPGLPATGITSTGECTALSGNFIVVVMQECQLGEACAELFISEYLEGTSNNKAIEVYNPTSSPVDLAGYGVYTFNNGATNFSSAFGLSGILNPGEVFVVSNSSAAQEILAVANATSNVANFNGNDAVQLRFNDIVLDAIGVVGENPTPAWTFGSEGSTLDRVLVRKASVNAPTTNWLLSTGQWDIYSATDLSHIGQHTMSPCDGSQVIGFSTPAIIVEEDAGTIDIAIEAFNIADGFQITIDATPGTATPNDYSGFFPVTLDIPSGNSLQTLTVGIIDDAEEEGTEFFQLTITTAADITYTFPVKTISIAPNDPVYEVYSIADMKGTNADGVLDSLNVFCELRGIVHTTNFNGAGLHFHMLDNTGGIKVFRSFENLGYIVAEGDSVHVRGLITQFMGQAEIFPAEIDVMANDLPVQSGNAVTAFTESLESQPVILECTALSDIEEWTNAGGGFFVEAELDGATVTVRIDGDAELFGGAVPEGRFYLRGVIEQEDAMAPYDSGYRLWPSFESDLFNQVIASFDEFDQLQYGDNGATVDFVNTSTGASTFEWAFGDGASSNLSDPAHEYDFDFLVNEPDFVISLIATSETGCSDTSLVAVSSFFVGVDEQGKKLFSCYPNPFNDQFTLSSDELIASYVITDISGRIAASQQGLATSRYTVPAAQLSSGTYTIRIHTHSGVVATARIIRL